jgi:hypothetical protein
MLHHSVTCYGNFGDLLHISIRECFRQPRNRFDGNTLQPACFRFAL